jgi:glycosyltransferase involved in cell wall biosynthesis
MPTYNRAHLIAETLDSISAQTYKNWECIIVDDGSIDNTHEVLAEYCKLDKRFNYYHRPTDRPKGANACRNYGFELSKGSYVSFFDSDDIMYSNKIALSLNALKNANADFVISKTIDFNHPKKENTFISQPLNYNFKDYQLTHYNYTCQKLNWLTPDTLIIYELAKKIRFNETLKRGQEYNYYVKLTSESENGVFLDKFTTKRRLHSNSIKSKFNKNEIVKDTVELRMITFQEIYSKTSEMVKRWFTKDITFNATKFIKPLGVKQERLLTINILKYFGVKAMFYYALIRISKILFNKGEFLRQRLKRYLV